MEEPHLESPTHGHPRDGKSSYARAVERALQSNGSSHVLSLDEGTGWIRVVVPCDTKRKQGWKLHVSATVKSAEDVLLAVLPVLLSAKVTFKVALSPAHLADLNDGRGGLSQVGKFVTVYPRNDISAVV